MRICIVTRIDYKNYGNRLQNYALKTLFEEEKWESVSGLQVYSKNEWEQESTGVRKIIKIFLPFFVYKVKIQRVLRKMELSLKGDVCRNCFVRFTQKHIETLPPMIVKNDRHLYNMLEKYNIDYYVSGSDQVWNPQFSGRDYEFLTFAPYMKRLSFAASFGVSSIPQKQRERYKKRLNGMRYISVREKQGVKLAVDLTGRDDIDLVIDPTLLLKKNEWEKLLMKCSNKQFCHYIVAFFLGEIPDAVQKYASQQALPLLNLNSKYLKKLYSIGPIEYLSYIHDAACILTDSFHALAFSIKFHREFYVFRREEAGQADMFSRIESLLDEINLTARIQSRDLIVTEERITDEKWGEIDEYLLSQKDLAMKKIRELVNMDINENENKMHSIEK